MENTPIVNTVSGVASSKSIAFTIPRPIHIPRTAKTPEAIADSFPFILYPKIAIAIFIEKITNMNKPA